MDKLIFIIDDDPFWTAILTQHLHELGYTNIKTFSSGQEGITNLPSNPDLIFLDYQLEEENGLEVLQSIKDFNPGIGVIFCTGYEDLSVAISAIEFGSFDYLLKGNASKREISRIIANLTKNQVFARY